MDEGENHAYFSESLEEEDGRKMGKDRTELITWHGIYHSAIKPLKYKRKVNMLKEVPLGLPPKSFSVFSEAVFFCIGLFIHH